MNPVEIGARVAATISVTGLYAIACRALGCKFRWGVAIAGALVAQLILAAIAR